MFGDEVLFETIYRLVHVSEPDAQFVDYSTGKGLAFCSHITMEKFTDVFAQVEIFCRETGERQSFRR